MVREVHGMYTAYTDEGFNNVFARIKTFFVNIYEYLMNKYVRRWNGCTAIKKTDLRDYERTVCFNMTDAA